MSDELERSVEPAEAGTPKPDESAAAVTDAEREERRRFAAESGKARHELVARIDAALAEWTQALGEPGKVRTKELSAGERQLRVLVDDLRQAKLTRRDRRQAWQRYQAAWAEVQARREQASLTARAYFQSRADEIAASLKGEGPDAALARLKQVQRERAGYLFSKQDWDEVEQVLAAVFRQIREEAVRRSPAHRRLEERLAQSHEFLARLERQGERLRSVIAASRRQWEVEGSVMRAALLKNQIADAEADLKRLGERVADVRNQTEKLRVGFRPRPE